METDKPIINNQLLKAMSGLRIAISKLSIEQEKNFCDSPLNTALSFRFDNSQVVKCYCCDSDNTNWCWNCEKPHCDKHAKAVFCGFMINTLCSDCAERLIKYAGEKHALKNYS